MTFSDSLKETREQYSLALASLDAMEEELAQANTDIDFVCEEVMGCGDSYPGVLGFYMSLFNPLPYYFPGSTILNGKTSLAIGDVETTLLDAIGRDSGLFSDDNDFSINKNNAYFKSHNLKISSSYVYTAQQTIFTSQKNAITANTGTPEEPSYDFTASDKSSINSVFTTMKSYATKAGSFKTVIDSLVSKTQSQLSTALGSISGISFPSLSSVSSALTTIQSGSWLTSMTSANTTIQNTATYSDETTPNSGLVSALNTFNSAFSTFKSACDTLKSAINSAFQISSNENVTGFRKHWVYWLMKLIDRPTSYRMTKLGAETALSSLNNQAASAEYIIKLVATDSLYLSTPELYSVYHDPDLGQYVAVFSALPCYKQLELQIDSSTKSFEAGAVIDNSEVRFTGSISSGSTFKIRLKRDSYYSDWSQSVGLSQ